MKLVGVKVKEKSTLTDQYLEKLRLSEDIPHILFTTIIRDGETIIPTGRNRILPGDIVYFISETEKIPSIMKLFGYRSDRIKRVMIHGGTFIGMHLAKFLEKHDVQVKIIDSSAEACSKLVRNLNKSVVLNETATDQSFLQQENVGDMGAFIAVTGDDEDNILSTLLAKRLGTPWAVTLTKQISYIPLITTIGVDVVISPRLIANSAILHFIRQGKVLSVSSVQDDIEILEIEALETSNIVNIQIREAKIPKGALILSVERDGNIIIPDGSTVIQPGNKVLVQADNQAISKVEKLFTVKMEYF